VQPCFSPRPSCRRKPGGRSSLRSPSRLRCSHAGRVAAVDPDGRRPSGSGHTPTPPIRTARCRHLSEPDARRSGVAAGRAAGRPLQSNAGTCPRVRASLPTRTHLPAQDLLSPSSRSACGPWQGRARAGG
jgi:hypothetical protein